MAARFLLAVLLASLCGAAWAGTISLSYTGTLLTPQSDATFTFTLTAADSVQFQTWSFGGGTNAAGQLISPGGFDPMVTLFSGSGPSATIYTDSFGNPLADADSLSIGPPTISFVGNCPPAGTVSIGTGAGSAVCADDDMQIANLPAGTYTLVLTTAENIPVAVDPGTPTTLAAGFTDFSGGATSFVGGGSPYQTCNITSNQPGGVCIDPAGNYAVDIVAGHADLQSSTSAPEPQTLVLLGLSLAGLAVSRRFRKVSVAGNRQRAAEPAR